MADLTVSADVDSMMAAANNAAIRAAISVPALVGVTVDNAIVRNDGTAGAQQVSIVYVTDTGDLQLAGKTSSFPMLKRNGTQIDVRLADDSAYAALAVGLLYATDVAVLQNNVTMEGTVIKMTALPTSDPAVAGQLWLSGTALQVSAG